VKIRRTATPIGVLECLAPDGELAAAATELALESAAAKARIGRPVELAGRGAWLKASPLRGRARWRHALREHLLRQPLPRVREAENFEWLARNGFLAPRTLAAGALRRRGVAVYQFLIASRLEGAAPLVDFLATAGEDEHGRVLGELASEVARMHALSFVHRDLYARNLLVAPSDGAQRIHFIDAWRGGARLQLRGEAYDLACFFLQPALTPREQSDWLRRYESERARHGRPIDLRRLVSSVRRERAALARQAGRDPGRWRGPQAPALDWTVELDAR
jgi:tRNA A-37 threonylcarbamoyl transferase component Bud32